MKNKSIAILRITLGIVFLWFGLLKLFGVSPVVSLIAHTYSFLPTMQFVFFLGIWEVVIGVGLLLNKGLKIIIPLLWLQMLGTLSSALFNPSLFYTHQNIFALSMEGEFLAKNLVLIAASLVIFAHDQT